MKRKIASLDVYVDSDSQDSSGTKQIGPNQFVIQLNPKQEIDGTGRLNLNSTRQLQTTLAHELGHFVALITGDQTHKREFQMYYQLTGDTSPLIPAEKLAWELAHEIKPDLDTENERLAMESYTKMQWGNFPMEPIPSGLPMPKETAEARRARLSALYWKAEDSKRLRARVIEFGTLGFLFVLYWFAGLLTLGGAN